MIQYIGSNACKHMKCFICDNDEKRDEGGVL